MSIIIKPVRWLNKITRQNIMKIIFKSSLGITLAALIALSTPSQANEDDEIDCENAETTYEISVCAAKEADLKKAEVNKIIASLPDSAVLSKAVISWQKYISDMKTYKIDSSDGSMRSADASSFESYETAYMAQALKGIYEYTFEFASDEAKAIANEYRQCLDKNASAKAQCHTKYFKKADKLLNSRYKTAKTECADTFEDSDDSEHDIKKCISSLKKAEISWIAYRDAFAKYIEANDRNEDNVEIFKFNATLEQAVNLGEVEEGSM